MADWWEQYKVDVPVGSSGDWRVKHFEVDADAAHRFNMRIAFSGTGSRFIQPGHYTELARNGQVIMSDTPAEIGDLRELFKRATGRVLIGGLGLGVAVNGVLQKPEVQHVLVIERSPDVIKLTGAHWRAKYGDRLTIEQADILTWKPPKDAHWDCAWFDIWDEICGDDYDQHKLLRRRFARLAAWKECWCAYLVKREHAEDKRPSGRWF